MKPYFWSLITAVLLLCVPARADVFTVRINSASSNIPTTFGQGSDSLVLQGIRNVRTVLIDNRTAGEIAVNCSTSAGKTPASVHNIYVDGTSGAHQWAIDNAYLDTACYIRSNTGSAITTGVVVITVVGG